MAILPFARPLIVSPFFVGLIAATHRTFSKRDVIPVFLNFLTFHKRVATPRLADGTQPSKPSAVMKNRGRDVAQFINYFGPESSGLSSGLQRLPQVGYF